MYTIFYLLILLSYANSHEDEDLDITEIIIKYGYEVEEHNVVTEDGYNLAVFRIPGNRTMPILLFHGIADCADTYVLRGNTSPAIALARAGYDVWIGNYRVNRYSAGHTKLSPTDPEYFNFSLHEIGIYDLPATIDYILDKTGQQRISAIGHSMGNAAFYVMGSVRPEYNDKINVMLAFAPIAFLNHVKSPIVDLINLSPLLNELTMSYGINEILTENPIVKTVMRTICSKGQIGYQICAGGLLFSFDGYDSYQLEPEFLPVVIAHYPSKTSSKAANHMGQIGLRKRFAQYDYGSERNLQMYNSTSPPDYDLSKVTMRVAMFVSNNDNFSPIKDVQILKKKLPNVVLYHFMEYKEWNHVDYVWAKEIDKYLYPYMFKVLNDYK